MTRKSKDKENSGKTGPEHAGWLSGSDPGRDLEYENIPDPISFDGSRTDPIETASDNNESHTEKQDPPQSRG